jgi:hypothetical protein
LILAAPPCAGIGADHPQEFPTIPGARLSDPDPVKTKRVMEAMLKMHKLDIAKLKQAPAQL